jgi:hypothetical protein
VNRLCFTRIRFSESKLLRGDLKSNLWQEIEDSSEFYTALTDGPLTISRFLAHLAPLAKGTGLRRLNGSALKISI